MQWSDFLFIICGKCDHSRIIVIFFSKPHRGESFPTKKNHFFGGEMIIDSVTSSSGPTYYTQEWINYYAAIWISITGVQKFTQFLLEYYVGVYQYVKYLVPSCNAMCTFIYHHSYWHPHVHGYRQIHMGTIQNTILDVLSRFAHIHKFAHENIHAPIHTPTCMSIYICEHSHKHALAHGHTHTSTITCLYVQ